MIQDAELKAMQAMVEALEGIEEGARARVLSWVAKRYGVSIGTERDAPPAAETSKAENNVGDVQYASFSDLFDAASPTTENESVLVGAFWFQQLQGNADFSSQQINDELKNLGHAVSNVTRTFDRLRETKPALALQIQKSGKSKQARKRYRLTAAGIKEVIRMLTGEGREE
jgi:hypothetical protein